ncbi:MAG: hypothetical protein ACI4PK_03770 [Oscillospiraceae bacterium]
MINKSRRKRFAYILFFVALLGLGVFWMVKYFKSSSDSQKLNVGRISNNKRAEFRLSGI